jgi:hypothetical protein
MTTTTTSKTITLSKNTLSILKNFASMNSNILIKPGNDIKTITPSKNAMAESKVEETFDIEFGIWDLNKFLGVISLFSSPSLEFDTKFVTISGSNGSSVKYYYSEPRLLTTPTKQVNMPKSVASISLSDKTFNELQKASSVLQLPDIQFVGSGKKIIATVLDLGDPTTNSYKIEVGDNKTGAEFRFNFKMENIRLLPGNYDVEFAKNVVGQFTHETLDLTYWFAMENTSTYSA